MCLRRLRSLIELARETLEDTPKAGLAAACPAPASEFAAHRPLQRIEANHAEIERPAVKVANVELSSRGHSMRRRLIAQLLPDALTNLV